MRHILISIILLTLVFTGGMVVQHHTEIVCREISTATDRVLQTNPGNYRNEIAKVLRLCADKTEFLSIFHHHSLTETLTTNLRRAAVYAEAGNYTEMCSELQAARSTISTLAHRDTLTIANLF